MPTLIAYLDGDPIYQSEGKWLHPLLELESVLDRLGLQRGALNGRLTTRDKVVGRAGALLSVRLGIREIDTELLSARALPVLEAHGVVVHAQRTEERIFCATEDLLAHVSDPDQAHRMILARIAARQAATQALIRADSITVRRGGQQVICDLSLTVHSGDTLLIRGENGTGKTTLLRALLGLESYAHGTLEIRGRRVGSSAWSSERHRTAYVRQIEEPTSLPISVLEVVEIGSRADAAHRVAARARDALHRTGASHLERRLFGSLSGGERQRVSIARALAQGADVLLLDEPTSGLDPGARASLLALLDGLAQRQNVTVVIVSHDITWDELPAARVLTMRDGTLHEELHS
ncbi:MAG: DUF1893 domain-containing protein [Spirochaetota bacterium]